MCARCMSLEMARPASAPYAQHGEHAEGHHRPAGSKFSPRPFFLRPAERLAAGGWKAGHRRWRLCHQRRCGAAALGDVLCHRQTCDAAAFGDVLCHRQTCRRCLWRCFVPPGSLVTPLPLAMFCATGNLVTPLPLAMFCATGSLVTPLPLAMFCATGSLVTPLPLAMFCATGRLVTPLPWRRFVPQEDL